MVTFWTCSSLGIFFATTLSCPYPEALEFRQNRMGCGEFSSDLEYKESLDSILGSISCSNNAHIPQIVFLIDWL